MEKVHSYIASNERCFIDRLREAVEIPSVSCWPTHRNHCIRQMDEASKLLKSFGVKLERIDIGNQELADGTSIPLPPIVLA